MLRYIPFISIASLAAVGALVACGSLSDPDPKSTKSLATSSADSGLPVTQVSGAITGAPVSNDTRIAVVWRAGTFGSEDSLTTGVRVLGDAPITNGKFTVALTPPPSDFFTLSSSDEPGESEGISPSLATPSEVTYPSDGTEPLTIAIGAFVVYRDTNGNGVYDLDPLTALSSDIPVATSWGPGFAVGKTSVIYYAGGSTFDYEKIGAIGGPPARPGFNVLHALPSSTLDSEGMPIAESEWIGLDQVEVPSVSWAAGAGVCGSVPAGYLSEHEDEAVFDPFFTLYPVDGQLTCSPDGYSFSHPYWVGAKCVHGPPPGLCNDDETSWPICSSYGVDPDGGKADAGLGFPPGSVLPRNWPCEADGGVYSDAGPVYGYFGR